MRLGLPFFAARSSYIRTKCVGLSAIFGIWLQKREFVFLIRCLWVILVRRVLNRASKILPFLVNPLKENSWLILVDLLLSTVKVSFVFDVGFCLM